MKTLLCLLCFLILWPAVRVLSDETVLRTALQDSPPKAMSQGASVSGICHDIIHELNLRLADSGLRIDYLSPEMRFLPWKRSQRFLAKGRLDLIVGMAISDPRKALYHFSRFPIYQVHSILVGRTDSPIPRGGLQGLAGQYVIAIRGTKTARMLQEQGGIHVSLAPNPLAALEMLLARRGDYVFYHDLGLLYLIKSHHWQGKLAQMAVIERYGHYVAYSRQLPLATRDLIDKTLDRMREDGTLERIVQAYR